MERKQINDLDLEKVVGGSIIFNDDCTMCGYNTNDQYVVVDFKAVHDYIKENKNNMSERRMLSNMVSAGLLRNP